MVFEDKIKIDVFKCRCIKIFYLSYMDSIIEKMPPPFYFFRMKRKYTSIIHSLPKIYELLTKYCQFRNIYILILTKNGLIIMFQQKINYVMNKVTCQKFTSINRRYVFISFFFKKSKIHSTSEIKKKEDHDR